MRPVQQFGGQALNGRYPAFDGHAAPAVQRKQITKFYLGVPQIGRSLAARMVPVG